MISSRKEVRNTETKEEIELKYYFYLYMTSVDSNGRKVNRYLATPKKVFFERDVNKALLFECEENAKEIRRKLLTKFGIHTKLGLVSNDKN